jgi:hemoglobin
MAGVPIPDAPPVGDIADAADVELLVRRFYQAAIPDPLLGPLFHAAGIDWSVHIPLLRSFWERELLGVPGYAGNVVAAHRPMLTIAPLGPANLNRWVELFDETIDELFRGPIAEHAKRRARHVAAALTSLAARDTKGCRR